MPRSVARLKAPTTSAARTRSGTGVILTATSIAKPGCSEIRIHRSELDLGGGQLRLGVADRFPAVRAGLRPRLAAREGEAENGALHGAELLEQRAGVVRQLVLLADG